MRFNPNINIGDIISNSELISIFHVRNSGGMRRSKKTGTLVIICDHTNNLYDDKWHNDILFYTGMGKIGDQDINKSQNKTLVESKTNNIEIHLFEVFE